MAMLAAIRAEAAINAAVKAFGNQLRDRAAHQAQHTPDLGTAVTLRVQRDDQPVMLVGADTGNPPLFDSALFLRLGESVGIWQRGGADVLAGLKTRDRVARTSIWLPSTNDSRTSSVA
jgi:hypothetical protein